MESWGASIMTYKAKENYKDGKLVSDYDKKRFKSLKGHLTNRMELYLIDKALDYACIRPPATIIDVPCGTGRVSIHLAQKGFIVKGIDISPEMVEYTQEKVEGLQLSDRIQVKVGDAEFLPYEDDTFDACVTLRLFGHTPEKNRKRILHELIRVSKNHLILAYYLRNSLQYLIRKRGRERRNIEWYPVSFRQISKELDQERLKKIKKYFLAIGFSETMVVLCLKDKEELQL